VNFNSALNDILLSEKSERVGSFAIQTDHPGLMPGLKKRKTTKTDRSLFANDDDASKQYITGMVDPSGKTKNKAKNKIYEKISNRMESLNGD